MSDLNKIGALWEKEGKRGTFFSGKIGDTPVFVFSNQNKSKDTQPDWEVFSKTEASAPAPPVQDDDIPF